MSDDKPVVFDELPTPLQIVNALSRVLFHLKQATGEIRSLRVRHVEAKDAYSKAFKQSKLDLKRDQGGTQSDREDQAQLANWDLYEEMSKAEAVLQYAKEKRNDLSDELSALQSIAGLVKQEMQLAGRV